MSRSTSARIAGFTFLFYIAAGVTDMILSRGTSGAAQAGAAILVMAQRAAALTLAITLYRVTRNEGRTLATLGMICRLVEGVISGFIVAGAFFAVGSTFFSWLFLRGRTIPVSLAWLGVVASVVLVVALPLQAAGILRGPLTQLVWIPMAAFEIPLGAWLLIKGVPARIQSQSA